MMHLPFLHPPALHGPAFFHGAGGFALLLAVVLLLCHRAANFRACRIAGWERFEPRWPSAYAGSPHAGRRWRAFETGNAEFDRWKGAQLERLEAERRRLEEAHRDFAAFLHELRRARDREEFERFMAHRTGAAGPPPAQPGEQGGAHP